jgi:hypothetical protein
VQIFRYYLSGRSIADLHHFQLDVHYDHCSRYSLQCGIDGHSGIHDDDDSDWESDDWDGTTAGEPFSNFYIPQRMVTLSSPLLQALKVSPDKLDLAECAVESPRTSPAMLLVAGQIVKTDMLRGQVLKVLAESYPLIVKSVAEVCFEWTRAPNQGLLDEERFAGNIRELEICSCYQESGTWALRSLSGLRKITRRVCHELPMPKFDEDKSTWSLTDIESPDYLAAVKGEAETQWLEAATFFHRIMVVDSESDGSVDDSKDTVLELEMKFGRFDIDIQDDEDESEYMNLAGPILVCLTPLKPVFYQLTRF